MVVTVANKRHFTIQTVFSVVTYQIIHFSVAIVHLRGHSVLYIEKGELIDGSSIETQILHGLESFIMKKSFIIILKLAIDFLYFCSIL